MAEKGKTTMNDKPEKAIETAPIRLTSDETRALMKLSASDGTPIETFHACGLVDLGLAAKVETPAVDFKAERKACWERIQKAAQKEDKRSVEREIENLDGYTNKTTFKKVGFTLTPLGKQIARGVTVRLNGQAKQMGC